MCTSDCMEGVSWSSSSWCPGGNHLQHSYILRERQRERERERERETHTHRERESKTCINARQLCHMIAYTEKRRSWFHAHTWTSKSRVLGVCALYWKLFMCGHCHVQLLHISFMCITSATGQFAGLATTSHVYHNLAIRPLFQYIFVQSCKLMFTLNSRLSMVCCLTCFQRFKATVQAVCFNS